MSDEDAAMIEEEDEEQDASLLEDLPEWHRKSLEEAKQVLGSDDWLALPRQSERHDWSIMPDFARHIDDPDVGADLLDALHGRAAYRRFRDTIRHHGVEDDWRRIRADFLRNTAVEWLDEHGIPDR